MTIDQRLSYPFLLKSLKNWSLTVSMNSSIKITFSTTNQDSGLMALPYISSLPLHITFSVLLILTLHCKFQAFSLIYLKHSIEFGMMVSFVNSRVMELTVNFLNLLNRLWTTDGSGLFSMVNFWVWKSVTAGVVQDSVVAPLFFFIYINDLPLCLTTNVKLFANETSLFWFVNNASVSASRLNNDFVKIWDWAFNWKISFNPDPTKQAKEVIFFKKKIKIKKVLALILSYFSTIH